MTLTLRALLRTLALILLALVLLTVGLLLQRYRQFAAQPRPIAVATAASPVSLPAGDFPSLSIASASRRWALTLNGEDATLPGKLAQRYPGLKRRFPEGVLLTLMDAPAAPEPLRGPYDSEPTALLLGAVFPWPEPGQTFRPLQEAWAGCRRDLELGPARQLHCYLYARGEAGDILDGLAVLAWVQAMDVALSGRAQEVNPAALPFLSAHKEDDQWHYSDAIFSLSPLP